MPIIYRVIQRQKPGTQDPENCKFYMSRNSTGLITTKIIASEIAASAGQSEGTILGLLEDLHNEIVNHLKNGYSVRMGNIGILRCTLQSTGQETEDLVDSSTIKRINVRLVPSVDLKKSIDLTNPNLDFKQIGRKLEPEEDPDMGM